MIDSIAKYFCTSYNTSCWPTHAQLATLYNKLDPSIDRNLIYDTAFKGPLSSAVPVESPDDQPLYGMNKQIKPLYIQQDSDNNGTCFVNNFFPEFCLMSTRNNPLKGQPAFIAWPTNVTQILGTGHDYLNRHTCEDTPGILIRMSLFKSMKHNLSDTRGPEGTIQLGAGTVFDEAHKYAAQQGRFIASGWARTVGIVGWTLGGGHGPFSASAGLGVDNLVEAEIVLAGGSLVTVSETGPYSDLFWALRGGGGSTWGIVISLTIRMHFIPKGGFTIYKLEWSGDFCRGEQLLSSSVEQYYSWMQKLGPKWSGQAFFIPTAATNSSTCASWKANMTYFFQGSSHLDPEFNATIAEFLPENHEATSVNAPTAYDFFKEYLKIEYIFPIKFVPTDSEAAGLPSVFVSKSIIESGTASKFTLDQLKRCNTSEPVCITQELFHDLTGNIGSTQNLNVSISPTFRTALIHYVMYSVQNPSDCPSAKATDVLGKHAYFGESHYNADDWKTRYWGDNYEKLSAIKSKYDPNRVFSCHHCVE